MLIKKSRTELGLIQEELAKKSGTTKHYTDDDFNIVQFSLAQIALFSIYLGINQTKIIK